MKGGFRLKWTRGIDVEGPLRSIPQALSKQSLVLRCQQSFLPLSAIFCLLNIASAGLLSSILISRSPTDDQYRFTQLQGRATHISTQVHHCLASPFDQAYSTSADGTTVFVRMNDANMIVAPRAFSTFLAPEKLRMSWARSV